MKTPFDSNTKSWRRRFSAALRGVAFGIRSQSSCLVHAVFTTAAVVAGVACSLSTSEWCAITMCIGLVWTAELLNTAVESMARAVTTKYNDDIRDSLDVVSGGVLVAAMTSVAVGIFVFGPRLWVALGIPTL